MTLEADVRWQAVKDKKDGNFFFAVKTTNIYCRPNCAARTPLRQNVVFYASSEAAERAGFRACKRCEPAQASKPANDIQLVHAVCRLIESQEREPTLLQLAHQVGLSPFHMQRLFKKVTGLSPKEYAAAHRAQRIRKQLKTAATITDAIYESGYNSAARFYDQSKQLLGMTVKRYQQGAPALSIRFAVGECSLGSVLVAATEQGVCAILLGDEPEQLVRDLEAAFPKASLVGGDANFERLVSQVVGVIEQPRLGHDLPLDVRGTAFQQRVWKALTKIPAGKTVSYQQLAKALRAPKAVRAVANACAANTLAVAIPCHRVVRTDGGLSGYRWGVERKRSLLEREKTSV